MNRPSQYDEYEKQREVAELNHLADDAFDEGKFATVEQLLERAEQVALALGPVHLPSLIKTRFWLADARRMQGKYSQAVVSYTWLVALTTAPSQAASASLTSDEESLWYLAKAYMDLVECGRRLPELEVEKLLAVVKDGLRWLEQVGKSPSWSSGLRFQRGYIYKMQGQYEQAQVEMENALALGRRYPDAPGYSLASHLLSLAVMLNTEPFEEWERVVELAEEVLAPNFRANPYDRYRAYTALGWGRLNRAGQLNQARAAALESLNLAHAIESPAPIYSAYELLVAVYLKQSELGEAAGAVAQEWKYARKLGTVDRYYASLVNCTRVRLAQAKARVGLMPHSESNSTAADVGEGLGREELSGANKTKLNDRSVRQLLGSARRFVGWATPLAYKLDRAARSNKNREEIEALHREIVELELNGN
jgi:tetratricopeptide (TPR) repeat protein